MKKLLLLFLVVFAGAYSANAKKIYVENTKGWSSFRVHMWNDESHGGGGTRWPGIEQTNKQTIDGKDIYTIDLGNYEYFILNNGTGGDYNQTSNLVSSNYQEGAYYYIDSNSRPNIHIMTLYTYNFTVTTSQAWSNFYIYLFCDEGSVNGAWPGKPLTGSGNVNTYSYNSFKPNLGVVFNLGQDQHQTYNLSATPGDNEYTLTDTNDGLREAVTVTTNGSGYATFVTDKALNISTDAKAYTAEDTSDGSARLTSVSNPAANTPMLIKGNNSTTYFFVIANSGTPYDSNAFKAGPMTRLESVVDGKYNYILNGDGFYAANGKNVGEGKAYLQLGASGSKANLIFPNGDATSISSIMGEGESTNVYYNLQGMQVSNPTKGMYILNGKKIMVK